MYQEDAEYYDHMRQLVANEMERQQGTGMVDLKRDDWIDEPEPEFIEDEDGSLAYARMLERQAEEAYDRHYGNDPWAYS